MSDEELNEIRLVAKSIEAKLSILRNFVIVADQGIRQQQSAANDEVISVLKDISGQLNRVLRMIEK